MPRISALTALTTVDNADELAIVDVSASVTKKITRAALLSSAPLPNNTVTTAAIADNAVTAIRLDADETTDFASPVTATANTWVDLKGNQSFTIASASSVVAISIKGAATAGTAPLVSILTRIVIDSGGTPIYKRLDAVQTPPNNTTYPFIKFGMVYVTGLSAGTHTIKTQVYAAGVTMSVFCRPALAPTVEFFSTQVIEHKK